ncbi:MAG TPA: polysaccharide biosynthesis/export family protein [Candidatus Limnocylindrales bacterium]|nr:polysaccharide biosynthesis/export family protein [Candidatus Limnocylindrales bacterium]
MIFARNVGKAHRAELSAAALALLLACVPCPAQQVDTKPSAEVAASSGPASGPPAGNEDTLRRRDDRYRLCVSDAIAISFPLTPEFNQTVNVQPDGYVSLAGVADVHLAGMTTAESIAAIRAAYAKVLHDPIVTVELRDFNKPYFVVSGQVFRPGKYDLRGYTTATQAIAIAGGLKESAKHSQVLLFRRVNDNWYEVKNLNLKRILQGHDVSEDAEIRAGDMLVVPQNTISKIKKFIPNTGVGTYYQLYQ